ARLHALRLWIEHLVEGQGNHAALHVTDDGAILARFLRAQKLDRPITQVARVLGVEGNRIGAAQLITEVLVDESRLEAQGLQAKAEMVADHAAKLDLAEPEMAVRVAGDLPITPELTAVHRGGQALLADGGDEPFGQDHDAVMKRQRLALDDRANDDVAQ